MSTSEPYKPDYIGYGVDSFGKPPQAEWPNGARLCISFVINYEEGGEKSIINGDDASECYGTEIVGTTPVKNDRNLLVESFFEYGSRVGHYRLLSLFRKHKIKTTIYAVGKALEINPKICQLFASDNHDVATHHYRWGIDYRKMSYNEEKKQLVKLINIHKNICDYTPKGMYIGSVISNNTKRLLYEVNDELDDGDKIIWQSDCANDDIPFWDYECYKKYGKDKKNVKMPLLNIPYSYDTNDFRFTLPSGYVTSNQFFEYLKDAFHCLLKEGGKLMNIGLHGRIIGHPGRFAGIQKFVEYIMRDEFKEKIWIATRTEIAQYWTKKYPPNMDKLTISKL